MILPAGPICRPICRRPICRPIEREMYHDTLHALACTLYDVCLGFILIRYFMTNSVYLISIRPTDFFKRLVTPRFPSLNVRPRDFSTISLAIYGYIVVYIHGQNINTCNVVAVLRIERIIQTCCDSERGDDSWARSRSATTSTTRVDTLCYDGDDEE